MANSKSISRSVKNILNIDTSELKEAFQRMNEEQEDAIMMYAQTGAQKFENYAKENRRWKDRTGRARKSLTGYVTKNKDTVRVNIAHGVSYGIYLEMAHEKKYAILDETVKQNSEEVLEGYKELLEELL